MPRQAFGTASVSSTHEGPQAQAGFPVKSGRAASGKRKEEEIKADGFSKKGRAAFGDLTNQSQAPSRLLSDKVTHAASKAFAPYRQELSPWSDVSVPAPVNTSHNQPWTDIDAADCDDQLACTDYVHDIVQNLLSAERKRRPCINYMEVVQQDVNTSMRAILVDWLVEVSQEYKLVSETLFLAVNYIDRFLSQGAVPRRKLQLVGITCMLIAAKYEEIYAPQIDEFCYITDNTYTRDEMLAMEQQILGALSFELTVPTSKTFLRRFLKAACSGDPTGDSRLECLSSYLTELVLPEYRALQFLPSQIAASAVFLANNLLGQAAWTPTLQHYSGYKPCDLMECVKLMYQVHSAQRTSGATPAIRDKYAQPKYCCVSAIQGRPDAMQNSLFR